MKTPIFHQSRPMAVPRRHALALALAGAVPSWAQTGPVLRVRWSHVVAADSPKGQTVAYFQRLVAERSAGSVRVEVYPDSSLYGDEDELEALRLGAVEFLAPSLSKLGSVGLPEFEGFDLPFLFDDLSQVRQVLQGGVGQGLLQRLQTQQMQGLGFLDNGFKHLSARRPLWHPSDCQGLRMRIQASQVLLAQMRAWGAEPVVLPFGETRHALAQRVVDGTENPLSNFLTQGLSGVQPHLTLTQHGYLGYVVLTHPRFWASVSEPQRKLLSQALTDALAWGNRQAAALDHSARVALLRQGAVQLHTLTSVQRQAWRQTVQGVYRGFAQRVGAAMWQDLQRGLAMGV